MARCSLSEKSQFSYKASNGKAFFQLTAQLFLCAPALNSFTGSDDSARRRNRFTDLRQACGYSFRQARQ